MARFGDEVGMLWDEPPVIKPKKGSKKSDFNSNVGVKQGYKPPDGFQSFLGAPRIGLDTETKDPGLRQKGPSMYRGGGFIAGVGIARTNHDATYYPVAHANRERCIDNPDAFWNQLRHEAAQYEGEVVTANGIYDFDWLQSEQGVVFPKAVMRDVVLAEGLIDENKLTYGLESLGNQYLGEGKATDVLKGLYGAGYIENMDMVDPGHAGEYCERDCTMVLDVLDKQSPVIESQGMNDLFDLESRLTPLLVQMRKEGVRVNVEKAEDVLAQIEEQVVRGRQELNEMAGVPIDVFAGATIARACDHLGIEYPRTPKSKNYPDGQPSFRKQWLSNHSSPFLRKLAEQRGFEKIGGTFVEGYILNGHVDGRIHGQFHQLKGSDNGARTGRFSSSNPNLQNIPKRHKVLGPLLRSLFIPEEGMLWGGADWSQIEYRLLAHYAHLTPGIDAERVIRMYQADASTDFHQIAADITGKSRSVSKNINFGVVYGMGVKKMAADLGVSYNEGKRILSEFHGKSPFLKQMLDTAGARASSRGHITTMLGRRRRFVQWEYANKLFRDEAAAREYAKKNPRRGFCQVAATHKALNALLQGSAADLMKLAMVECYEAGLYDVLVPHLTVHDEMNVSVPDTKIGREAFKEQVHIMENCMKLAIPVLVDAQLGSSWMETKDG